MQQTHEVGQKISFGLEIKETHYTNETVSNIILRLTTGTKITSTIVRTLYKPSASLTCSARAICSQSINSSMRLPQVASEPFNHSLNTS